MLLDNPLTEDQRVLRESQSLVKAGWDVTVYGVLQNGYSENEMLQGVTVKRIFNENVFGIRNHRYLKQKAKEISENEFDVLHVHDAYMLRMGVLIKKLKPKIKLVYDSHEMFHDWQINMPQASVWQKLKGKIVRRIEVWFEKQNAAHIDFLITVNDSIARKLKSYFNLKTEPLVIRNIPLLIFPKTKSDYLHRHFKIDAGKTIVVFFGNNVFAKTINLEMALMQLCKRTDVAVVIISRENTHQLAMKNFVTSQQLRNVFFHPFIPFEKSNEVLSSADIGLVPSWNKNKLSYWLGFDSKFMDYMMAEIPVLATRQPEYEFMVNKYHLGVTVNPYQANAFSVGFDELIKNYKHFVEANQKAKLQLNWETEGKKFVDWYSKNLLSKR